MKLDGEICLGHGLALATHSLVEAFKLQGRLQGRLQGLVDGDAVVLSDVQGRTLVLVK